MSKVLKSANAFVQQKNVESRVSRVERLNAQLNLKDVDTTGMSDAQIDAAVFSNGSTSSTNAQPSDGLAIQDSTNGLFLIRQDGSWTRWLSTQKATFTAIGTLASGWSNSSGYEPLGYWVDPFGMVHLRGGIQYDATLAAGGYNPFSLPTAAQPNAACQFPASLADQVVGNWVFNGSSVALWIAGSWGANLTVGVDVPPYLASN